MTAANKRSIMTLFSDKSDIYCHQVKIVLAEKGVAYETENVDPQAIPEDLMELNPYGKIPTLVERDLVLYNPHIIMEYLDERYPHPPLMPVYPILRGRSRLLMMRIEQDLYPTLAKAEEATTDVEKVNALAQLKEEILSLAPIFNQNTYFMSEEFSLVDCYIAPLLWRAQQLGIRFTGAGSKAINTYMSKVFERDSFLQSIGSILPKNLMDEK